MDLLTLLHDDRRRFVRLPLRLSVDCELLSDEGKLKKVAGVFSRDISAGGLGMQIALANRLFWGKLQEGITKLRLRFILPGKKQGISCLGRVCWKGKMRAGRSDTFLAGLEFLDLDDGNRALIAATVRQIMVERLNKEYKLLGKKKKTRR